MVAPNPPEATSLVSDIPLHSGWLHCTLCSVPWSSAVWCREHCKAKGGVGRKNCSLGSSVSRGADPRRAPRPDPRAGPRPDPRPKISGPLGPEIFGRGSGRGPARGSGRGARRGSAPRLTLLPWLQFFLPTPTFALQCYRLISTIQLRLRQCGKTAPCYAGQ